VSLEDNITMLVKRLILFGISAAIGAGLTFLIVLGIGTTPAEFGFLYFFLTSLCLAVIASILFDKFMGTNLLPE